MEQYSHLLIAADSEFVANTSQIVRFFDLLITDFQFQFVKSKEDWMPGLIVTNSAEEIRISRNSYTGEEVPFKIPKRFELEHMDEIGPLIDGESRYDVKISGKWPTSDAPIKLLLDDKEPFEGDPICFVSCSGRARPVCTGDWWGKRHLEECEFGFDDPASPVQSLGVFTHPWTGERVEVAEAGNSRFWVEFEFGKSLLPAMDGSFDVLKPRLVEVAEQCFGTKLIQAGREAG